MKRVGVKETRTHKQNPYGKEPVVEASRYHYKDRILVAFLASNMLSVRQELKLATLTMPVGLTVRSCHLQLVFDSFNYECLQVLHFNYCYVV